ncbi:hypothetical protein [Halorubrum sp. DTA46]|uniref:hypothetical protein n=1 Tax=Halorubrum sp. DTA46 TaxID=3402162 RepID=UPI003AAC7727
MIDSTPDGRIRFEVDEACLCVCDALEGEKLPLYADREIDSQPALPELFPFPVDRAISFETESISIPSYAGVGIRSDTGEFIAQLDEPMELPRGSYCVDISGVTKVYVRATDVAVEATGAAGPDPVDLQFDRPTTVTVGARSLHSTPEATMTVPDDPGALAEAVSVLGSSIKEFSPERSWPTLRGYPPRIERGEELDVPSPLVQPETGVEVVVRPTYEDVYRLSTLAYYLGARMVTGDAPAVRLDTGYVERLPTDGIALEERAEELLRTWFFLDTLARTEGYVPSDRYEYEQVGPKLPFYPPNLADLSMSERLMEYLEVNPDIVAPYVPDWPTEAVLRPVPEAMELLPHLAHVLAPVRVRGSAEPADPDAPVAVATSTWLAPDDGADSRDRVPNPDADPLPPGTAVLTPEAYENGLRRPTTARGDVRLVALAGSADRAEVIRRALSEPAVPDGIGSWEVLERPDSETVSRVLSDPDVDLAYCGLPVDGTGVVAADGRVDLSGLDDGPTMIVFEETDRTRIGVETVRNGTLSAICSAGQLSPCSVRTLLGGLSFDLSVSSVVWLLPDSVAGAIRTVGDPSTSLTSDQGLPVKVISVRSVSPESHQVTRMTGFTMTYRIGSEQSLLGKEYTEKVDLIGDPEKKMMAFDTVSLLEFIAEPDIILKLNGEVFFTTDTLTEERIRESACRALATESDTEPPDLSDHPWID